MNETLSAVCVAVDTALGGVLLANTLEDWLAGDSGGAQTEESANEPENYGTPPQQARLHLRATVDECPGVPSPGEYRAAVCAPADGTRTRLERIADPDARPGSGKEGYRDDEAGGLQDAGCGSLDGPGGRGICAGSLASGALEPRLAPAAGIVCADRNAGHRRGRLLRPV